MKGEKGGGNNVTRGWPDRESRSHNNNNYYITHITHIPKDFPFSAFFFLFFFTAFLLGIHIAGVENRDGEEWFGGWCVYLRVCVRVCMYGWTN